MAFKSINTVDVSYDNKAYGNIIDPYEWNNNFYVIEENITGNANKLNENFTMLAGASGADNIGITNLFEDTEETSTLKNQLLLVVSRLLTTYTIGELDAKIAEFNSKTVSHISYNSENGCFIVHRNDGSNETIDTNIEKIPVSVELSEVDGEIRLIITNYDGSTTYADVSSLLNIYRSTDSETIEIVWDGNTFTAKLKAASVQPEHLSSEVIGDLEKQVLSAASSALDAKTHADNAAASEAEAEKSVASANNSLTNVREVEERVVDLETGVRIYQQEANMSAASAGYSATESKSYAVGGTGIRDGEDTDNAKYYMEQAKEISGGDFVTHSEFEKQTKEIIDANAYELPTASVETKGGIKIGSGFSMNNEALSVDFTGYATQSDVQTQIDENTVSEEDVNNMWNSSFLPVVETKLKNYPTTSEIDKTLVDYATLDDLEEKSTTWVVYYQANSVVSSNNAELSWIADKLSRWDSVCAIVDGIRLDLAGIYDADGKPISWNENMILFVQNASKLVFSAVAVDGTTYTITCDASKGDTATEQWSGVKISQLPTSDPTLVTNTEHTISSDGWIDETETTALWRYRISNTNITDNSIVNVHFSVTDYTEDEPSSLVRATNSGVLTATTSGSGYVDVYSVECPDSNLSCKLEIIPYKEV